MMILFHVFISAVLFQCVPVLTSDNSEHAFCPKELVETVDKQYLSVFGDVCFYFNIVHKKNFQDARTSCKSFEGLLAMPKTKEINEFLRNHLKFVMKPAYTGKPVWIGLNDFEGADGDFIWEDNSTLSGWSNFDNFLDSPSDEDCVAMHTNDGSWHDYKCSGRGLFSWAKPEKAFVCQFSRKPSVDESQGDSNDDDYDTNITNDAGTIEVVTNDSTNVSDAATVDSVDKPTKIGGDVALSNDVDKEVVDTPVTNVEDKNDNEISMSDDKKDNHDGSDERSINDLRQMTRTDVVDEETDSDSNTNSEIVSTNKDTDSKTNADSGDNTETGEIKDTDNKTNVDKGDDTETNKNQVADDRVQNANIDDKETVEQENIDNDTNVPNVGDTEHVENKGNSAAGKTQPVDDRGGNGADKDAKGPASPVEDEAVLKDDVCPEFNCPLDVDCSFYGYTIDDNGCQTCECSQP